MSRSIVVGAVLLLAAAVASVPRPARGCAPAPRAGESVDVADETALIIWDDSTRTEHFIRQATFVGDAYDFGFLVPTPNRPQVESADAEVFDELARMTEPKTEHRTEEGLSLGCSGASSSNNPKSDLALPGGVVVLEEKRVGNLDAKVLSFRSDKTQRFEDTADEVLVWLNTRGYAVRPDLKEWLRVYIQSSWIITAFKIAGQGEAPARGSGKNVAVKASAVRMSFQTDRPFFPYREPAAQRDAESKNAPRLLRVYIAARQRMNGKIGNDIDWPGQTVWANNVAGADRASILGKLDLKGDVRPDRWWVTEFEDRSSPRPGTDELYFWPSIDRTAVVRPAIVVVNRKSPWWAGPLLVFLVIIFAGAALLLVRRLSGRVEEPPEYRVPPPLPGTGENAEGQGPKPDPRRWT